jgi:hypothetical protein
MIQGKVKVLGEYLVSVPPCPLHIPQGLTWDRIQASALGDIRVVLL